jgi:hypothetical protein
MHKEELIYLQSRSGIRSRFHPVLVLPIMVAL